jgi:hypothetical protein
VFGILIITMDASYDTSANIAESTRQARVLGEIEVFVDDAPQQHDMAMILLKNGDRAASRLARPTVEAVEGAASRLARPTVEAVEVSG